MKIANGAGRSGDEVQGGCGGDERCGLRRIAFGMIGYSQLVGLSNSLVPIAGALAAIIKACRPGTKIVDLCTLGDEHIDSCDPKLFAAVRHLVRDGIAV